MKRCTAQEFLLTYGSWQSMMQRCVYKGNRPDAPRYRDAGITVYPPWKKFVQFFEDMGVRPSKGHSLDRIDGKKGYYPGNCRWATAREQAANTKSAIKLLFKGETHPVAEWARRTGFMRTTIQQRLAAGWSVEDTLTKPTGEVNSTEKAWATSRAKQRVVTKAVVEEAAAACGRKRANILVGQKFGKLTTVKELPGAPTRWKVSCSCGGKKVVRACNLMNGSTQSCGCLRKGKR